MKWCYKEHTELSVPNDFSYKEPENKRGFNTWQKHLKDAFEDYTRSL